MEALALKRKITSSEVGKKVEDGGVFCVSRGRGHKVE